MIMVSGTFFDLKEHRSLLIGLLVSLGQKIVTLEHDSGHLDQDLVATSLRMVRDSDAYIGIIGNRYGHVPLDPKLNPDQISITQLEFEEAVRLQRPVFMFIMDDRHTIASPGSDTERTKVRAFHRRVYRARAGELTYVTFDSVGQFGAVARTALPAFTRRLDQDLNVLESATLRDRPSPPELTAFPGYFESHAFVGRRVELERLDEWSGADDACPVMLIDAIGGSGKSMLCWKWLTAQEHSQQRAWAGRFWYSFYDSGAGMADFCRQALAYVTGRPFDRLTRMRMPELSERLLAELKGRPWLFVLDGVERLLVAYQRRNAAQLRDESGNGEKGLDRNPHEAAREDDERLLRALAAAAPSKILCSSRLAPQAFLDRAGAPVPGVHRMTLAGLTPTDAEAMFRACGVTGDSGAIQSFLTTNSDCNPLVIGTLAGVIDAYGPDRGNFDRWLDDPNESAASTLEKLNLVQRRNHILSAALEGLAPESLQLLQTLAFLDHGASFELLQVLNPHLPPQPRPVQESKAAADFALRSRSNDRIDEPGDFQRWLAYLDEMARWKRDPAVIAAPGLLAFTIRDLERRGLLRYDFEHKNYDLHPVVRGITFALMDARRGGDRNPSEAFLSIRRDIKREWTKLPVADLCVRLLDFLAERPSSLFEKLTFPALAEGVGSPQVDELLIAAVTILVSSRFGLLKVHATFIDQDCLEYEIDVGEISNARETGCLTHPSSGDPVADYAARLVPYVAPSSRMIAMVALTHA